MQRYPEKIYYTHIFRFYSKYAHLKPIIIGNKPGYYICGLIVRYCAQRAITGPVLNHPNRFTLRCLTAMPIVHP